MNMIAAALLLIAALICVVVGLSILRSSARRSTVRQRLEANRQAQFDPTILRIRSASSIGILNRLLGKLRLTTRVDTLLVQAGLSTRVNVFLLGSFLLTALTGLIMRNLIDHALLAFAAACAAGLLPLALVLLKRERRTVAFNSNFPDAIDLMVNALRAGFAINGAIQMVADESPEPIASEFRVLFEEQRLGLNLRQALVNLGGRVDSMDLALFVTAVVIQRETGGNLAEVLEKIASVIRDRFRILGEIRTFTAQGRLTGLILGALPIFLAVAISFIAPDYMRLLVETDVGKKLISAGVVMGVLGFLVMRRIIEIKV